MGRGWYCAKHDLYGGPICEECYLEHAKRPLENEPGDLLPGPIVRVPDGNGVDEGPTKPSNPKDAIGSRKAPLSLVPWTLVWAASHSLLEGALKYGRFNWRIAGVRASIYLDALKRHIAKWENGQDVDPKTLVHHIDSAIGCLTILRDAMVYDKLEDDRPPCSNPDRMAELIDGDEQFGLHLRECFKEHNPHQFTIADTQGVGK